MKTRKQKITLKEKKNLSKKNKMKNAHGDSKYARKHAFLNTHGGWGFEYAEKPWA